MNSGRSDNFPTREQLTKELARELAGGQHLTAAKWIGLAAAVLLALLLTVLHFIPLLRIYGNSMSPALREGELVLCFQEQEYQPGDIIAFYYDDKILVKRVICKGGDWFDMDEDGQVYVNGDLLKESYVSGRARGSCDLVLPLQIPKGTYFVMGDQRATSVDSRISAIGCISKEQIIGKVRRKIQ